MLNKANSFRCNCRYLGNQGKCEKLPTTTESMVPNFFSTLVVAFNYI